MKYDVIIIGTGIIGSNIAYRLSKYDCKILVIDKENDVANEVSEANSAIIHAGHDPENNTLKALLNPEGSRMYEQLCKDLQVDYQKVGSYTVEISDEQEEALNALVQKCIDRNVAYEVLSGEQARKNEPNLGDNVKKVLYNPDTAIVSPWEVALACLQVANTNGTEVKLNTKVEAIDNTQDCIVIHTNNGEFETKYLVNAAGLHSDEIAKMYGDDQYKVVPKRGEYFVLSHKAKDYVKHIVYPIPTAKGKGVLAIPTVHHNILLGPNSEQIDDKSKDNTTLNGLGFVRSEIGNILKNVPYQEIIRTFSGLRPSTAGNDFIIEKSKHNENIINLVGIDSPGIASAPAIAKYVEEKLALPYSIKENYQTKRQAPVILNRLSVEQRNELIKLNPAYGRIVCRCEVISEGEIIDAIKAPLGARSIKGVKKRVRPGMGKCQGGYCQPVVLQILKRELKLNDDEVLYDGKDSNIVMKGADHE